MYFNVVFHDVKENNKPFTRESKQPDQCVFLGPKGVGRWWPMLCANTSPQFPILQCPWEGSGVRHPVAVPWALIGGNSDAIWLRGGSWGWCVAARSAPGGVLRLCGCPQGPGCQGPRHSAPTTPTFSRASCLRTLALDCGGRQGHNHTRAAIITSTVRLQVPGNYSYLLLCIHSCCFSFFM
jgi:hypothetical protein